MKQTNKVLEICVDSLESAIAAEQGGADRIELCSALVDGGITPSAGLLTMVRKKLSIGVFVMIRPRGGDFLYSEPEFEQMKEDIRSVRQLGADGVVFGILNKMGRVDIKRTRRLVEFAAPLPVTFHRAFDMTPDLIEALDAVVKTGASRILTSGGAPNVTAGMRTLAKLVQAAKERITIIPGGGVKTENIAHLAEKTKAHEYHASARSSYPSPMLFQKRKVVLSDVPGREFKRYATRVEIVRGLSLAIGRPGKS